MYLYRLLSFFKHRRQNAEFLVFTSKFEILLIRLKAAWMDLMPVHTAQSPEVIDQYKILMQEEWPRISKSPVSEPRLQICCPQTIQKYSGSTSAACRQDTRTHFPSATIVRSAERKTDQCNVFEKHLARRTTISSLRPEHPPKIHPSNLVRKSEYTFYTLEQ